MESFQSHQIEGTTKNYKLFKDVLHNPTHQTLSEMGNFKNENFLQDLMDRIINLHTHVQQTRDAGDIHKRMELQKLLPENQLLVVEDIVLPLAPDNNFYLKEGPYFYGVKDPFTVWKKYCRFHCCC